MKMVRVVQVRIYLYHILPPLPYDTLPLLYITIRHITSIVHHVYGTLPHRTLPISHITFIAHYLYGTVPYATLLILLITFMVHDLHGTYSLYNIISNRI